MEHARHATLTIFFLLIRRHVALALIKINTSLPLDLLLLTVLLVLLIVKSVMLMGPARHVLTTMLLLVMPKHAAFVLILPLIYLLVKLQQATVLLVEPDVRHAALMESVLHAMPTII